MSAITHITEYACERCKGMERKQYGSAPPPGWRWIGRGHQRDDLYRVLLLCRNCDQGLDAYLDGHPISEGES